MQFAKKYRGTILSAIILGHNPNIADCLETVVDHVAKSFHLSNNDAKNSVGRENKIQSGGDKVESLKSLNGDGSDRQASLAVRDARSRTKLLSRFGKLAKSRNGVASLDVGILESKQRVKGVLSRQRLLGRFGRRARRKNASSLPDLGILTSLDIRNKGLESSPKRPNTPATSKTQSKINPRKSRSLQSPPLDECPSACTDQEFCDCAYGDAIANGVDCTPVFANACRTNDSYAECLDPSLVKTSQHFYCPMYTCMDQPCAITQGGGLKCRTQKECTCDAHASVCTYCSSQGVFATSESGFCTLPRAFDEPLSGFDSCNIANCCELAEDDAGRDECFENKGVVAPPVYWIDNSTPAPPSQSEYPCYSSCGTPEFCKCIYNYDFTVENEELCISTLASACRSGDYVNCLDESLVATAVTYYCPIYECLGAGGVFYECLCKGQIAACDFCRNTAEIVDGTGLCLQADQCVEIYGGQTVPSDPPTTAGGGAAPVEEDVHPALPNSSPVQAPEAPCYSNCGNSDFCKCLYSENELSYEEETECIGLFASACKSGDYNTCLDQSFVATAVNYYCPIYECLDSGGVYDECFCRGQISACNFCESTADDLENCEIGADIVNATSSFCIPADECSEEYGIEVAPEDLPTTDNSSSETPSDSTGGEASGTRTPDSSTSSGAVLSTLNTKLGRFCLFCVGRREVFATVGINVLVYLFG